MRRKMKLSLPPLPSLSLPPSLPPSLPLSLSRGGRRTIFSPPIVLPFAIKFCLYHSPLSLFLPLPPSLSPAYTSCLSLPHAGKKIYCAREFLEPLLFLFLLFFSALPLPHVSPEIFHAWNLLTILFSILCLADLSSLPFFSSLFPHLPTIRERNLSVTPEAKTKTEPKPIFYWVDKHRTIHYYHTIIFGYKKKCHKVKVKMMKLD